MMKAQCNRLATAVSTLLLLGTVTGCASIDLQALVSPQRAPQAMAQQIAADGPSLQFDFEFDDKADATEGEVGSGYIVVSQGDKELQALPHAFEFPADRLDPAAWLDFQDFNADGFLDFKATRLYEKDGEQRVESLYQFDPKTGKFSQVDSVSNSGSIRAEAPGCLTLTVQAGEGVSKTERHCFISATSKWALQKPDARQKKATAKAAPEVVCTASAPDLVACRRARIEQDRALLTAVRDYRVGRSETLKQSLGRGYANAYARSLDLDHQSWRNYRDARCSVHVREQGIETKALPAATEYCRLEWSRDQMLRYRDQMAYLGSAGKKRP